MAYAHRQSTLFEECRCQTRAELVSYFLFLIRDTQRGDSLLVMASAFALTIWVPFSHAPRSCYEVLDLFFPVAFVALTMNVEKLTATAMAQDSPIKRSTEGV